MSKCKYLIKIVLQIHGPGISGSISLMATYYPIVRIPTNDNILRLCRTGKYFFTFGHLSQGGNV